MISNPSKTDKHLIHPKEPELSAGLVPKAFQKPEVRLVYRLSEDYYKISLPSLGLVCATRSIHLLARQRRLGTFQLAISLNELTF